MVETVPKRFSGRENHFQGLFCFETKAMVETVPKTVFFSGCENHFGRKPKPW